MIESSFSQYTSQFRRIWMFTQYSAVDLVHNNKLFMELGIVIIV
jgi:hypothetical protein